jgi:hypothetical protein
MALMAFQLLIENRVSVQLSLRASIVSFLLALVTTSALYGIARTARRSTSGTELPIVNVPARYRGAPGPGRALTGGSPETPDEESDRFSNDVSEAVARYRLDAAGTLYEVHSPRTEVPHLRPPKS